MNDHSCLVEHNFWVPDTITMQWRSTVTWLEPFKFATCFLAAQLLAEFLGDQWRAPAPRTAVDSPTWRNLNFVSSFWYFITWQFLPGAGGTPAGNKAINQQFFLIFTKFKYNLIWEIIFHGLYSTWLQTFNQELRKSSGPISASKPGNQRNLKMRGAI